MVALRLLAVALLAVALVTVSRGPGIAVSVPDQARCAALAVDTRYPATPDEASALRARGATWTDREIRELYVCRATAIGVLNAGWKSKGSSPEQRARRAYQIRRTARLAARAMMASTAEVTALRLRDLRVYGRPNGPTFDDLVERARSNGMTGEAVYESIVASAQRTSTAGR